jgi:tetratricopeptide (TPR) repeat protein
MTLELPEDPLNLQAEAQRQGPAELYQPVLSLVTAHHLAVREARLGDSLSASAEERQQIEAAFLQFRALPAEQQAQRPALQHALGQLEIVAGSYEAALRDLQAVANRVADDPTARAAVLMSAYQAALEQNDGTTAVAALQEAAKLDPGRWTPFPLNQHEPQRLLGVGGFGVVVRCWQRNEGIAVIIRMLRTDDLDGDVAKVLADTRELGRLEHPAILRPRKADYGCPDPPSRPYLVFDNFTGLPLDKYLTRHGPLAPADFLAVAPLLAEGLQAAHAQGVAHGQVKPGNVLVQRDDTGWRVKLTDFGLVYKPNLLLALPEGAGVQALTAVTTSLATAREFSAPEQTGQLPGVPAGPATDLYSFARTCCYALFQTSRPSPQQWESLPPALAELLNHCLNEAPHRRPTDFANVVRLLGRVSFTRTDKPRARPVTIKSVLPADPEPIREVVPVPEATPVVRPVARPVPRPAAPRETPVATQPLPPVREAPARAPARPPVVAVSTENHGSIWPWIIGGGIVIALLLIGLAIIVLIFLISRQSTRKAAVQAEQLRWHSGYDKMVRGWDGPTQPA